MKRAFPPDNNIYGIEQTEKDLQQKEKTNQMPEKHHLFLKWDPVLQFNMQGNSGESVSLLGQEFTKWSMEHLNIWATGKRPDKLYLFHLSFLLLLIWIVYIFSK